jgi:two-component system, OmpR family, phosphate regulon sensor histidine kinase PhoR
MTRLLRIRPLVFAIAAGALLLTLVAAWRSARALLERSLAARLPADEVARIVSELGGAFVLPAVVALLAALLATALLGHLVARPLRALRRELLAAGTSANVGDTLPPIGELRGVANALERHERELEARARDISLERDRFSMLVASVSEGILQVSAQGRIDYANPAARLLLGLPDHVEGQPLAALVRNAELRGLLERAVAEGEIGSCEVSVDERRLLVAARPVPPRHGSGAGGVVVALGDLTELRRLEEVRRDFVANVSHELKTPLTSIRGYVETVLADDLPPATRRQFLEVVRKNAERLHRIVDDLLDLSRLESGGWRPELQRVDPAELAADVWAALHGRAGTKRIDFRIDGGGPAVRADPGGLRQVLSNLLDNAIRYTPAGGRIAVRIASTAERRVMLEVVDTGSGIPSDDLPRIFERFYRVDPARSRAEGGTGLGLSIVRHLVERMGGSVSAHSELGKGTMIRVELAAAGAADADAEDGESGDRGRRRG